MTTAEYIARYNLTQTDVIGKPMHDEGALDTTHFIEVEYLGKKFGNFEKHPEWLDASYLVWPDLTPILKSRGFVRVAPQGVWAWDKKGRYWQNAEGEIVRAALHNNSTTIAVGNLTREMHINRGGYWRRPPQIETRTEGHGWL